MLSLPASADVKYWYEHIKFKQDIINTYKQNKDITYRILKRLKKHKLNKVYLSVAFVESHLKTDVCSHAKACGMWQIIPNTAHWCGITIEDRLDEKLSTQCAIKYIKYLKKRFKNDNTVILAYNGGETRVNSAIQYSTTYIGICNIIKPLLYKETCEYLLKVRATNKILEKLGVFNE